MPQIVAGARRRRDRPARRLCRIGRTPGRRLFRASPIPGRRFTSPRSTRRSRTPSRCPGGYVYVTRQLMTPDGRRIPARLRARPRGRPHRRQSRPHPRGLCASCNPLGVLGQIARQRSSAARQSIALDAPARGQARHAELLARAGISGRHARPALHDRRRLRPCRRRRAAGRADPRNRARGARPGPHQPPDAGMGAHPPAEREPHAARASGSARDRPNRAPAFATATPSSTRSRASIVDDDPAQGIIDGPIFTHPDLRIQFRVPPGYLMSNGADAVTIAGLGREGAVQRRPLSTASLDDYILRVFEQLIRGQGQFASRGRSARPSTACRRHIRRRASTPLGRDRRQRGRLSMGPAAHLSLRDADAGRRGDRPVRTDGRIRCARSRREKRRRSGRA